MVKSTLSAPPVGAPTPAQAWSAAKAMLGRWFHGLDYEALLITLCANCAHFYRGEKPVWILALGVSGSGKTEVLIQANHAIPNTRVIGDITPAAFLSSFSRGGSKNTLLPPNGGQSIWLAKDFTTICSMRPDERKLLASRLRETWDGKFVRDTGVGPTQMWEGKVTLLAVGTPELEQYWGAMRAAGDRFLYLRWRSPEGAQERKEVMEKARQQLGHGDHIREELGQLITALVGDLSKFQDAIPPSKGSLIALDETADLVCQLRIIVERDMTLPSRPIINVNKIEFPTRIAAGLSQVIRTHQAMFHGPPLGDSLALGHRLARDTIPQGRTQMLRWVPRDAGGITYGELLRLSKIPKASLQRTLEDLTEMDVLDRNTGGDSDWGSRIAVYSREFLARLHSSGLVFT